MPHYQHITAFTLGSILLGSGVSHAQSGKINFNEEVRPILNKNCTGCHGGVQMAGGVSFIYRDKALGKGESGKRIIVPGDPDGSEFMRRILTNDPDDVMPPPAHGHKLDEKEITLLRNWIKQGADWEVHWAFEQPKMPAIPKVDSKWPNGHIDRFILAKMQEKGLSPAKQGSAAELLRRLNFDLIGMPPTIEELDAFEKAFADNPEQAWEAAVDRLLASEKYGERWASVWMDLARYADSEGLGVDMPRTVWPYRDWLIRAYNEDMPYDDFTIKQLAGDLLENPSHSDRVATVFHRLTQANNEGGTDDEEFRVSAVLDRVNTTWEVWQGQTFGCVQCHSHPYDTFEKEEYYKFAAFFNNTKDADTSNRFPTLKVPNDPAEYAKATELLKAKLSAEEKFYGAARTLAQSESWKDGQMTGVNTNKGKAEIAKVNGVEEVRTVGNVAQGTRFEINLESAAALQALRVTLLPKDGAKAASTPNWGAPVSSAELFIVDAEGKKTASQIAYIIPDSMEATLTPEDTLNKKSRNGWGPWTKHFHPRWAMLLPREEIKLAEGEKLQIQLTFNHNTVNTPLVANRLRVEASANQKLGDWAKDPNTQASFKAMQAARSAYNRINGPAIPVIEERDPALARKTHLFEKGNWLEKGKVIEAPATPNSFPKMKVAGKQANRLDMARWLASEENPLTARVEVNRLWQQLFGTGIVETLEDLGSSGLPPSNPELLDYLAMKFQGEYGWSRKQIIKEIVMSNTYRQTAEVGESKRSLDPRNTYLSYAPRRRLRAEAVRDAGLRVSGLYAEKMFGKPVYPPLPPGVWKPFYGGDKWTTPEVGQPDRYRRSLYTYWKRSIPYPALMSFDAPSRELCTKRRLVSNTPIAALTTLNDPAFAEFAQGLARVMKYDTKGSVEKKISTGYRVATSRRPNPEILKMLVDAYKDIEQSYKDNPDQLQGMAGTADGGAYTVLASLILNLDASLTK
ncbi:hypothetical protein Rhal01_02669 [Rubritalea halochordaticola]|uniref:Cytochrome c domain-containing protein n=1 Tax=Rubritalea halochordaticola TaxID=714537 RepID=A0ABP9V1I5_9BACT